MFTPLVLSEEDGFIEIEKMMRGARDELTKTDEKRSIEDRKYLSHFVDIVYVYFSTSFQNNMEQYKINRVKLSYTSCAAYLLLLLL